MPGPVRLLDRLPPPRRVLVVRAGRIGDLVCAGPAIAALAARLPTASITLVTAPASIEVASRLPGVAAAAAIPGFPGIGEHLFDARRAVRFLAGLQARRFELAVQLHGSGRYSNPLTLLAGAARTAGFVAAGEGRGLLDVAVPLPEHGPEVERCLTLVEALGAPARDHRPRLVVHGPERVAASRRLAGLRRPLVGLHVGARDPARRWPVAHALATAQAVAEGGTVVALGDLPLPAPQRTAGVVDLGGRLRLAVLAAVIERLDVLLTTDSGPAHLAYALGTPSVTVGLPVDAVRYAPPADGPHARLDVAASRSATGDGGLAVDDALDRCVLVAAERVRSAGRRTSGA